MSRGFIESNLNAGGEEWKNDPLCQTYLPYVQGSGEEPENELMNKIMRTTSGEKMISLWTLLLGPLYYVYRKCYKQAALYFLAEILSAVIPFGTGALQIVAALLFYKIYVKQLDEWIAADKDPVETGGTNMKLTIIIAAAFAVVAIVIYVGFLSLYTLFL